MNSRHKIDNIAKGLYIVVYSCTCAETLLLVWNFINILIIYGPGPIQHGQKQIKP